MKNFNGKIVLLFLVATSLCFAGKNSSADVDNEPLTLVTGVSPGSGGTGTIEITGDIAFAIDTNTVIVINGNPATLKEVHIGLQVLTQTAPGSSAPEIDLKTAPPAPEKKKKKAAST